MDKLLELLDALLIGMASGAAGLWLYASPAVDGLLRRKPRFMRIIRKGS